MAILDQEKNSVSTFEFQFIFFHMKVPSFSSKMKSFCCSSQIKHFFPDPFNAVKELEIIILINTFFLI